MNIQEKDQAYVANTYARFPVVIKRGEGSLVWDENDKQYIDLSGGIAVNTFGIGDREWMDAVTAQLGAIQHISNLYYTQPCADLAELLCQRTGMKRCSSPTRVRRQTSAPSRWRENTPQTLREAIITPS